MRRLVQIVGFVFLVALPGTGSAQTTLDVRGAFFALTVSDIKASTEWYRSTFGLAVRMESPAAPGQPRVVALEGNGLIVELVQPSDSSRVAERPESTRGPFKVGVIVADFEQVIRSLRARGVSIAYGPYPAHDGQRANAIIRDNAGNLIQLFAAER